MPKFRIQNPASNHRRKEGNVWKSYRAGDEIELTAAQFDSGKYDHLRLRPLYATAVADPVDADLDPKKPEEPVVPVTGAGEGTAGDATDGEVSREQIESLLARAKEAKVDDGSFEKVREEVVALDLFDNLPETKKGVVEALEELLKD